MVDFHGWTASALWQDIRFDLSHFRDIEKLAMVGDKAWKRGMATFCRPFTTAKIRYFDKNQMNQALAWIEEGLPMSRSGTPSETPDEEIFV